MIELFKKHAPEVHKVEYLVKAEHLDAGDYSLVFEKRDAARRYKKSLKESKRELRAHIYKIESENGYMYPEKEVW